MSIVVPEYGHPSDEPHKSMGYLVGTIRSLIPLGAKRILDVGSGNGYLLGMLCRELSATGVGIDISDEGVDRARRSYPEQRFEVELATPGLLDRIGEEPFDLVVSTEVVEHVYAPRDWAMACFESLRPGGTLLASTPYHGYVKNVLIAATGKFDHHVNPLWDGGHIKFWSPGTLRRLVEEIGFGEYRWRGSGRVPLIWKSLVASATRPHA
ncbi:MAG: class I SAM-dependent methyltransferase [Planctomycetota bacterium]